MTADPHPAAMTPEQMAAEIVLAESWTGDPLELQLLIANAIRSAVMAERARCIEALLNMGMHETATMLRFALGDGPTERYGCHCDLESMDEGFEPDGCVIDEGRPQHCIYSRCGDKWKCEYWRPIKATETDHDR